MSANYKKVYQRCPSCLPKVITMCACSVTSSSLRLHRLYVACQATLSKEFLRQEYWSGLPFPTSEDLSNPGINLHLLHWQADSSSLHHLESHGHHHLSIISFNKIHVKWEGIRINLLFWNFKMTHAHI